jgi:predicted nucleotide-binding protein (sugar kinase/HSP70/actin superfamily)
MRVGVPRAMLFHHYGDCWLDFLYEIGAETVLSGETSSATIEAGAGIADNETCLPVKVFSGHVMSLKEKTDAILVPRVLSEETGTCSCPKFLGLPDLARSLDADLQPVIAPRMDVGWSRWMWAREWYRAARELGAPRASAARAAARMLARLEELRQGPVAEDAGLCDIRIGVAGHLYNVHDERASLGLLDRLRAMGVRSVTVEQVDARDALRQARSLPRSVFWGFEERLAGAVLHWSRMKAVSGILFVTSFACGPGSIVGALLEDQLAGEASVPLMTITLDEHAAEAGLVTRLEAFVDMLRHAAATGARR